MLELTLVVSDQPDESLSYHQERITIGRAPGNTLSINASKLSSFHGQITRRDGAYLYQDLKSTNGSLVERAGERTIVDGLKTTEVPLEVGDLILLGDLVAPVVLRVENLELSASPIAGGTIVARRAVGDLTLLSAVVGSEIRNVDNGLPLLIELLHGLTREPELVGLLKRIAEFVFKVVDGAGSVLFQMTGERAEPLTILEPGPDGITAREDDELVLPENLLARIGHERSAVLLEDLPRAVPSASVLRTGWRSVIATPMLHRETVVGAMVVVSSGDGTAFAERHLELCTLLSVQASAALYNARLHERLKQAEASLREENRYLRKAMGRSGGFSDIIGSSPPMKRVFEKMRVVLETDTTVLVTGETGTGKELVARALHNHGARRDRLFAPVNCAAITESLLESELFGHVRGAFTGATNDKKGLFAVAHNGTLFLDEIGEISQTTQVKLLRAIQEGEITPVGSTRTLKINTRLICATNRNLEAEVEAGRFRQDLYYRINVFPIELPPLRERRADIQLMAERFIERYARKFSKQINGFTPEAIDRLKVYRFPGNVRELENELERAALFVPDGGHVDVIHLSDRIQGGVPIPARTGKLKETMDGLEKQVIVRALEEHNWNRSRTAITLGISRQALQVKLNRYGMVRSRD